VEGAAPDYSTARRSGDLLKHQYFKILSSRGLEVRPIIDCLFFRRLPPASLSGPASVACCDVIESKLLVTRRRPRHNPDCDADQYSAEHRRERYPPLLISHAVQPTSFWISASLARQYSR
jgi:hypothetical protein